MKARPVFKKLRNLFDKWENIQQNIKNSNGAHIHYRAEIEIEEEIIKTCNKIVKSGLTS